MDLEAPDAEAVLDHLTTGGRLQPYPGAVLWHVGKRRLVVVHKVLSPSKVSLRYLSDRKLKAPPFDAHPFQLSLPMIEEIRALNS